MDTPRIPKPPNVDNIEFNPQFPCDNTSGYHITQQELMLISAIVDFIGFFAKDLRETSLDKTLERFSRAATIDDASLVPAGDGIASYGPHTDNPAEDLVTVARIAKLMQHVVVTVDAQNAELRKMSQEDYDKEKSRRISNLRERVDRFARNMNHDVMGLGTPGTGKCACEKCRGGKSSTDVMANALEKYMDGKRRGHDGHAAGKTPVLGDALNMTKGDMDKLLSDMAKALGIEGPVSSDPEPDEWPGKQQEKPAKDKDLDSFMKSLEDDMKKPPDVN